MTQGKKAGLVIGLIMLGVPIAFLVLFCGGASFHDHEAISANRVLQKWTKADCELVWLEASALAKSQEGAGWRTISKSEIPEPLRRAGFRSAQVSPTQFRAVRGGSSFGMSAARVQCHFVYKDSMGGEPHLFHTGWARYFPDGRYESE